MNENTKLNQPLCEKYPEIWGPLINANRTLDRIEENYKKTYEFDEKQTNLVVQRPWGTYETIHGDDHSGYKVKKIIVFPSQRLSLQSHDHRSEHWVIVNGLGTVQLGNDFLLVDKNTHIYIDKHQKHRIENRGEELLVFIETQIGSYLGEDDIIRYQDDYNRV